MPYARPATVADVAYVASNLRKADEIELRRVIGRKDPVEELVGSHSVSRFVTAGCADDDLPFTVWGVVPSPLVLVGQPWLFGTDVLPRYAKSFIANAKGFLGEMHKEFPILMNYVDADNEKAIKWLQWMGFKFGEPASLKGHKFIPFYKSKE